MELHLERGAVIAASGDPADYTLRLGVGALSGGELREGDPGTSMLITADRAENVAITGGGVIDGGGRLYIEADEGYIYKMKRWRPFTLFLLGVVNLTLRDVVIRDGALWTVRLSGCQDVLIDGIRIDNDLKLPNNDGIDIDRCRNVRIVGCHIVSGDDCICLKTCEETAAWGGPCENVVVTGCTLVSTSSALIVGAECREPMRNIIFDSCVIKSSHRGLAIHLSEGSDVENVLFSNMIVETRIFHERWWGRGEPIYITAIPWTRSAPSAMCATCASATSWPAARTAHSCTAGSRAWSRTSSSTTCGSRSTKLVEVAGRPAGHPPLPGRGAARACRPTASSSRTCKESHCATARWSGAGTAQTTSTTRWRRAGWRGCRSTTSKARRRTPIAGRPS